MCKTFLSLVLFFTILIPCLGRAQSVPVTSLGVQVVLLKIDSYEEFQRIREVIGKVEGAHQVIHRSVAPDLITIGVDFSGDPKNITASLQEALGSRYQVTQKTLPSGATEINVAR